MSRIATQLGPTRAESRATAGSAQRSPAPPYGIAGALLGGLAAVLLLGIFGFQVANWDRITPGVTALGTSIGGLSRADAVARLSPQIESLLARPLQIRYADRMWNTTARDLGLRLDAAELAGSAHRVGREGHPGARLADQWGALTAGRHVSVSSTTDQAALDASIARMAREIERAPQDARLSLNSRDGTFQYAPSQVGLVVDVPGSRERVAQALASGPPTAELVVREIRPSVPNEAVQSAREQLERLLGGSATDVPLTLSFGNQRWPLNRSEVLKLVSLEAATRPGETASVKIDETPLRALASKLAKELNQDVQDARLNFVNGGLKVLRESKDGRVLDEASTVSLIKTRLLAGERSADLPVAVTRAAVSSEDPRSLGIVELVDRGSTSFAGSIPEKQHNIRLAAERLNGVVVPPGGTFSFNKAVGPTTLEAGFKWGFGITTGQDGGAKTIPSVAGGICQVATTLFQPVFWAGFPLEERYSHLYWIPAYTSRGIVGLDVTVDEESNLDFKWSNPTENYVLIQTGSDEGNVYFSLYGKKPGWKVQVDEPQITNRTPPDPKPVAEAEPSLPWGRTLAVETAREGFEALVTRNVIPQSGEPRTLKLKTTYQPSRTVTLVGTAGKPADARVEDAIARVLGTATPAPQATSTPAAAGNVAATPTVVPTNQAQATPKPTTGAAQPTPTSAPRQSSGPSAPAPVATPRPS